MTPDEVAAASGITTWDVLMIGDGSGTTWHHSVGWAVVVADSDLTTTDLLTGGSNTGTINAVELLPYLYGLRYHYYRLYGGKLQRPLDVHILSDSELTVNVGSGRYAGKKNADLWSLVDFWKTQGYNIHWHYTPAHVEGELEVHRFVDQVAFETRQAMESAPSLQGSVVL